MATGAGLSDVSGFLNPASIAVVGASDREASLGGASVRFLRKFGYPGDVWPVHPSAKEVAGFPAYPDLPSLPGVPDLVVFAIAAGRIPAAVRAYGAAGARSAVIWAGGFAEGGADGKALQEDLAAACAETGMSVLGPNCIGIISTAQPMIASFGSFMREVDTLPAGHISVMGQSGGLVTMAIAHARAAGFGFRYAISTGNEAVLTTADFIGACAQDPETRVIAAYMEGVKDGPRLLSALDIARQAGKPVVVLRGGSSKAAAMAAAAHTGALAGESRVWHAVFQEYSVVEVYSLEELIDVVTQIASMPVPMRPASNGVALVTFGGGGGVLAADQCERRGLATPRLNTESRSKLIPLVPSIASVQNPIDLTPQVYADPQWLAKLPTALDTIAADPAIDSVLLQYGPMAAGAEAIARMAKEFMERSPIPVMLGWPLAPKAAAAWLAERNVNVFVEYDRALRVISDLFASTTGSGFGPPPPPSQIDWEALVPCPVPGTVLAEHEAYDVLRAAGLPVAPGRLVAQATDLQDVGEQVGWPVAIKGMSKKFTHKFAMGLVALGIGSPAEAAEAGAMIEARGQELGADLEGLFVQHMVDGGQEVLVSALRDPNFGVIVSCGAGGVLTEVIDDIVLRRAPFGPDVAGHMLSQLRVVRRALNRGLVGPSLEPMIGFLVEFSRVAASAPWKSFVIEANPVKWRSDGVCAVDALIIIEKP